MVDELRMAVEHAAHQPEEVQRRIAALIEEALAAQEWEALLSSPQSEVLLARLSAAIAAEGPQAGPSPDPVLPLEQRGRDAPREQAQPARRPVDRTGSGDIAGLQT
jgi:hypothetical protein